MNSNQVILVRKISPVHSWTNRLVQKYRSGLEERVAEQITSIGQDVVYEQHKVQFEWPARFSNYTPDFQLIGPNGSFFVETKGIFSVKDRQKHLLIQEQCPHIDIRFVFSNSRNKLYKGSSTTYGMWCDKHNFMYSDSLIPLDWLSA